jgi:hypothetical protein
MESNADSRYSVAFGHVEIGRSPGLEEAVAGVVAQHPLVVEHGHAVAHAESLALPLSN